MKDADYVIEHIEAENPKALFRRATAYKAKGQLHKAAKDFETLVRVEPKNAHAKKEMIAVKLQLKEEAKNPSKIQEVEVKTTPKQSERKEESPKKESKNEEEPSSPVKEKPKMMNKTKMLDADTVSQATERAIRSTTKNSLQRCVS